MKNLVLFMVGIIIVSGVMGAVMLLELAVKRVLNLEYDDEE